MKRIIKLLFSGLVSILLCSCTPGGSGGSVRMLARVEGLGEKIEVSVLESEYTSGPHLVIISDKTKIYSKDGKKVTRGVISVGNTLEIIYSGQVMLSYPPQIVAHTIFIK